jgi:trimeric autotransporter adhesin
MLKTVSSVINAIGALNYKGTWNASTNNPTLTSGVGTKGDYYVVSVAGSTNLDGTTLWGVGDWAVFNGSIWQKVDGGDTSAVTSLTVTTLTGYMYANNTTPVTASTTIPVANITGAVPNTVNVIAGTGLSGGGALTGNVTLTNAGVTTFNTRNGVVTLSSSDVTTALGYTPGTGNVSSVTGTSPVVSSGGNTPAISIPAANATTNGYLTSSDWTTFNSKQPGGTYVTSVSGTAPVVSSGGTTPAISIPAATTSVSGYLTSTDWNTFNAKGSGNGTVTSVATGTGLTGGPITSTGTVSLASTAVTIGTYGGATNVASFTVDQQGRLTSASNVTIAIGNSNLQNSNVVLGNTTLTLGSTVSAVGNLSLNNVTINSVAATFPNNYLTNSTVVIGNTTIALGGSTANLGNVTISNVTIIGGTTNASVFNFTGNTTTTATYGIASLPLQPAGFMQVNLNGTVVKVPYYAV